MEQAVSILLGGETISASEVGHGDGIKLQLTCPFCHEPVLYVAGFSKISPTGRKKQLQGLPLNDPEDYTNVDAFFRHYKGISENAAKCEARSLTPEGREEIKRLATKARNQRLKLFQRRFWNFAKQSIKLQNLTEADLEKLPESSKGKLIANAIKILEQNEWRKTWLNSQDVHLSHIDQCIEMLGPELTKRGVEAGEIDPENVAIFDKFTSGLDWRFQKLVVAEACQFLSSTAGYPILKRLSELAAGEGIVFKKITQDDLNALYQGNPEQFAGKVAIRVVAILVAVPWKTLITKEKMLQSA